MEDEGRDSKTAEATLTNPPGTWLTTKRSTLLALADQIRDSVIPHIGGGQPITYADIPVHLNVGDLLINLGAELLFADHGIQVRNRISLSNPRRLFEDPQAKDGAVVLHGGGNFSDLYPHHETFRRQVVEGFPDTLIILLPQTVHYLDRERLRHDIEPWARHRKLVFMARDAPSYAQVAPFLGERVVCVPDASHYLTHRPDYLGPARRAESGKILVMGRRDIERNAAHHRSHGDMFDWIDLCGPVDVGCYALAARLFHGDQIVPLPFDPALVWYRFRDRLIRKAVAFYGDAGAVATDRLHGMLLALMMGMPAYVRDNSYGKLSNYIESWLSDTVERPPASWWKTGTQFDAASRQRQPM
ncbi:MAG TPA: polysaccharide pyruvyl transferase family protein [Azospirillum sp.]|nr:polysaccharide pyruvyl transferase family protein [Azospirillum sp.]